VDHLESLGTEKETMSELRDPEKGLGLIDKMKNALRIHKSSYIQTFGGEGAPRLVLEDLARFCRANGSVFHKDPLMQSYLTGRRDVWLHIQERLNLSSEELFNLQQDRKK
jgi:hypothetical protein